MSCLKAYSLRAVLFAGLLGAGAALGQTRPAAVVALPALPTDLNLASLRVNALTTLYEFDLSPEQLKTFRTAAAKTASSSKRTPVKANAALTQAFKDFQAALLGGKDDETIAKARNHVVEVAADSDLDDSVEATDAALAGAPAICGELKASQIAAFLAVHADQVADPEEMILGSLESIRDMRADEAGAKIATAEGEIATLISATAADASYLVYGTDEVKAKALAGKISAWLTTTGELPEKEFDAQAGARGDAVKKMIGTVDPIQVLAHWLNLRLAELMSNPELPGAVDSLLAARAAK